MRRREALVIGGLVVLMFLPLYWLNTPDKNVVGRWEATVETAGVELEVAFTFDGDGVYTCALRSQLAGEASAQGRYEARGGRLLLSRGLDYRVDPKVYDTYSIQRDTLTIQGGSGGALDGLFPLKLKRVEQ